jgi:uncharacterized protein YdaU (DUF1376 family)
VIWYKFHIGDYLTHTAHLNEYEDLVYRRLLDLYYMSEAQIPLDTKAVARKIRMDVDATESVLGEFFEKTEEGYFNSRAHAEVIKYQAQVKTNRSLGKLGGRPKKTESVVSSEPKDIPKKIQIQNITTLSNRFDEFWNVWPASKRKVGKAAAAAKWQRLKLDEVADKIIGHVKVLKTTEQWTTGFEPAPLTYINQRRWEDDAVATQPQRRII